MSYSGDQGQTIRQLINSHMLRRVAMCCLTSPLGKRQHLAVSHEKGKVTILQLSALLKQADTSKRKLTLTVSSKMGPWWCSRTSVQVSDLSGFKVAVVRILYLPLLLYSLARVQLYMIIPPCKVYLSEQVCICQGHRHQLSPHFLKVRECYSFQLGWGDKSILGFYVFFFVSFKILNLW